MVASSMYAWRETIFVGFEAAGASGEGVECVRPRATTARASPCFGANSRGIERQHTRVFYWYRHHLTRPVVA